jgi:hypothetical protein
MLAENFIPHITCPTRITSQSATLIDNIFIHHTSNTIEEKITTGNILTDITDHLPNFMIFGEDEEKSSNEYKTIRIYSEDNIEKFKHHLEKEEHWETFIQAYDCETATAEYIRITQDAHNQYFPKTKILIARKNDKKWITSGIKISCKKKHKLFIKYLKNQTEENREKWKTNSRILKKTAGKQNIITSDN